MSILDAILEKKRERLAEAKSQAKIGDLRIRVAEMEPPREFAEAVKRPRGEGIRLIAEVKKASPSKGPIRQDFRPPEIARDYARRADAISVLTEEDFFLGSLIHLKEVRWAVPQPVLRKDFIFEEYQVLESRAAGADAILLIEAILEKKQAGELIEMARELGMGVLFEVRDEWGIEVAMNIGAPVIGINNRDLTTFKVDLSTTLRLMESIRGEKTIVSESGIERRSDVQRLERAGVDAILVGTAFMESTDIPAKIKELMGS